MTVHRAARPGGRPGDGLLHPVALVALAVLIVNDHVLKGMWPGLVTGKLSDAAGLVVTPLFVQAAWEVGEWFAGRWVRPSNRVLGVAIALVGLGFAAVQVWPPATDAYSWALGAAQWPIRALAGFATGAPTATVVPVMVTPDLADLVTSPALLVPWWLGRRRTPAQEGLRASPASDGMT